MELRHLAAAEPRALSATLTLHEALSGITGIISLAAWIFLLVPQLLENYKAQSSAGISKLFLFIWLTGDICNLAGALWAGLVPTVIALGIYFCFADAVLILQCIYYDVKDRGKPPPGDESEEDEEQRPLLRRFSDGIENQGPPGSGRRSSFKRRPSGSIEGLPRVKEGKRRWRSCANNSVAVVGICAVGVVGWALAWAIGWWEPVPVGQDDGEPRIPGAAILGYASAVLYLGARLPQIAKNWREKSCEGLSLLFFILSLLGNMTQGATILFHSIEKEYFLKNLPWLIGSLGTMVEDVTIFIQFRLYNKEPPSRVSAVE